MALAHDGEQRGRSVVGCAAEGEQADARDRLDVVDEHGGGADRPGPRRVVDVARQGRAALERADDAGGLAREVAVGREHHADRRVDDAGRGTLLERPRDRPRGRPGAVVQPDDAVGRADDLHGGDEAVEHEVRTRLQQHGVLRGGGLALGAVRDDSGTDAVDEDGTPLRGRGEVAAAATGEVHVVDGLEQLLAGVADAGRPHAEGGAVGCEVVRLDAGERLGAVDAARPQHRRAAWRSP